ncbi:MAG: hypothetical protein K9L30_11915 [Desulfobacterales bacterium]|nr:hypothetical protein [Desulfobacterales bacterium]
MDKQPSSGKISKKAIRCSWVIVLLMVVFIIVKGLVTFFVVGDKGQPDWDYRPVKDVPGESQYADYPDMPVPQHVRGGEEEKEIK